MSKLLLILLFISCSKETIKKSPPPPTVNLHELAEAHWPQKYKDKDLEYVFDKQLIGYLRKVLVDSKSDHIAVSVIDNNTGNVLAAVGRDNKEKKDDDNLALKPFSPAASLIKVITSADLLEKKEVDPDTATFFRGRKATLYRYQLKNDKRGRRVNLHSAFTSSNNVVFAKLAAQYSDPMSLFETAENFYFNKELPITNAKVDESYFPVPETNYMFAELASGLNKKTMMSPLHASYIMFGILNHGILTPLKIFKEEVKKAASQITSKKVISEASVNELLKMMKSVVTVGTARSLTRKAKRKINNVLEFGGKTGRMTGGVPYGTRDWLAFYVKKRNSNDKGWSVAVMINNEERWTVRPTFIAKKVLEYYYSEIVNKDKVGNVWKKKEKEKNI